MVKVNKEQVAEMLELKKQGKSIKEISEIYGITYQRVYQLVNAKYRKVCKCIYCGAVTGNIGNICSQCRQKRKAWRELHALACHIKKLARR